MITKELVIKTYQEEKGNNFRMDYLTDYVIPTLTKFINKEVSNLDELKKENYSPIWDTRNNKIIKKILEQALNIKLTGISKKDKLTLQEYLTS